MKERWKTYRLLDICDVYQPATISKSALVPDGKYDVYGANGKIGKYIDYNHKESEVLLTCRGATCGYINVSTPYSWINGNAMVVHPRTFELSKEYLVYILRTLDYSKVITGAAQPQITRISLSDVEIPVPPLSEQERIVSYLDAEFAKIDTLKANTDQQLKAAKALFQSALKEMLTPQEGWERKKFGDLCKLVRGPFGGSLKKEIFVDKGYAVYEQQHAIYKNHDIRYYIPKDKYLSMKRFAVSYNDLIMSCSGTIGRIYVIPEDAPEGIINQALLKITIKKDILPNYLAVLMESSYFKEIIASYSDGAAIKNIAAVNVLKEIDLLVPPVDEQNNILAHLDAISEKVKALQANYNRTLTLCNDLKQSLLKSIFE